MDDRTIANLDIGDRTVNLVESLARIDLDNLSRETEEIGVTALWWGHLAAQARRRANELEFVRDHIKAELGKEARIKLKQMGERVTEDGVKEIVMLDPRYKVAFDRHLDAEAAANTIDSAKFTIARKQSHMEALTPLLLAEHNANQAPRYGPDPGMPVIPRTPVIRRGK
jgi:hypothetical protein